MSLGPARRVPLPDPYSMLVHEAGYVEIHQKGHGMIAMADMAELRRGELPKGWPQGIRADYVVTRAEIAIVTMRKAVNGR